MDTKLKTKFIFMVGMSVLTLFLIFIKSDLSHLTAGVVLGIIVSVMVDLG